MIGDDFDTAAISAAERQANSNALLKVLSNSPEAVDTKKALSIIAAGIDPNIVFTDGDTLLIHAAFAGNSDVVCALLENGADATFVNKRKETPLHYAAKALLPAAVAALLKHGADVYARDEFEKTAEAHAESVTLNGGKTMALAQFNVLKSLQTAVQDRIRRDMEAALLREEVQNFTGSGCATQAEVKPMKRLQIKPPGAES